jgi:two-component system response regulator DesR
MSRLAVLFVEDEPWVRDGVAKALRAAEPTLGVTPCGTVRAAIAAIGRADFDAALVDLSLPDGNGTDVIVALRSRQPACVRSHSRSTTTRRRSSARFASACAAIC